MRLINDHKTITRKMKNGHRLVLMGWSGFCLRKDGRTVNRLKTIVVRDMERAGIIQRIDDRTTRCGEEYGLT